MARTPEHDSQFVGWVRFTGGAEAPSGVTHKGRVSAPTRMGQGVYDVGVSDGGIDEKDARIAVNIEGGNAVASVEVAPVTNVLWEITVRDFAGAATDTGTISVHWERLPNSG